MTRHGQAPSHARVAIVGAGYVGLCLAAVLADRGFQTTAVDSNSEHVAELRSGRCRISEPGLVELLSSTQTRGLLKFTDDHSAARTCDVVIMVPGTPVSPTGDFDQSQLVAACRSLAPYLQPHQLVILKSTVPPGTTRNLVQPILAKADQAAEDILLAYCPERLAEGEALRQVTELPMVVGGVSDAATERAADFWRSASIPTHEVRNCEVAEVVKLASNWWIDHNIAMANELAIFCDAHRVDVMDVVVAANTIPKGAGKMNILLPSIGVGGSCLTKDPLMVEQSAIGHGVRLRSVTASRRVNDAMPLYAAERLARELKAGGTDLSMATVGVLGLAFKNNTGDLRKTPVAPFVARLRDLGITVRIHDHLADRREIFREFNDSPEETAWETMVGCDAVVIAAAHHEYLTITPETFSTALREGGFIFDGRRYFTRSEITELEDLGVAVRGVGR